MKKYIIAFWTVVISFFAIIALTGISTYNSLTSLQADVEQASSKIDTTLQRRYDLIPNVVNSVKGYMQHEEEIFTSIAEARSKIGSNNSSTQEEGQTQMDSAISRLLSITENYPELKADAQVSALIAELEGTENRIFVARNDYNTIATSYNKEIRKFPKNIFSQLFGFEKAELYEANENAEVAPSVNF